MDFNILATEIHRDNAHWWKDPATGNAVDRSPALLLFLINSELSEAGEGARKSLMDDHIPHRPSVEVEMADALIRILDMCGRYSIHLIVEKAKDDLPATIPEALFKIQQSVCRVGNMYNMQYSSHAIAIGMSAVVEEILQFCTKFGCELFAAMVEKREYNLKRSDHSNSARLAVGGKKW